MRLALVAHNIIRGDGQGRVCYETARFAMSQGIDVTLVADRVDPDLLDGGARWVRISPRLRRVNLLYVTEFGALADRALKRLEGSFELVQGFGFTLTRPHDISVAQFVHHAWGRSKAHTARVNRNLYGAYQWTYTAANTRFERRAFDRARVIVACSGRVRDELVECGLAHGKIRVIYNAADPGEFIPGPLDRAEWHLPATDPTALFVGDIRTPRKNLDTVLRALVLAPAVRLAVVGAAEGSPYPAMAKRLGVADRVHFLGFRKDVARIMRAVDMYVFPSRYEPFGIVVLEAMAAGIPVITASTVGAAEIMTPRSGIVVSDAEDAEELAHAIRELADDPVKRRAMGCEARRIAENHSWGKMAAEYVELYRELAS